LYFIEFLFLYIKMTTMCLCYIKRAWKSNLLKNCSNVFECAPKCFSKGM
jgi:hypothetical protein